MGRRPLLDGQHQIDAVGAAQDGGGYGTSRLEPGEGGTDPLALRKTIRAAFEGDKNVVLAEARVLRCRMMSVLAGMTHLEGH